MGKSRYYKRPMTQSAAVCKLRSYVNKCAFSVLLDTMTYPESGDSITTYTLWVSEGVTVKHDSILVNSRESFEEAFKLLDEKYASLGLKKTKKGIKKVAA